MLEVRKRRQVRFPSVVRNSNGLNSSKDTNRSFRTNRLRPVLNYEAIKNSCKAQVLYLKK